MELVINVAEIFFEHIGNALRQPPDYLEQFIRNSTFPVDRKPTPPTVGDEFIKMASRKRSYPIQEVLYLSLVSIISSMWHQTLYLVSNLF